MGKGPGRARLAVIGDYSAATLGGFVRGAIAAGSTVVSDGWSGYSRLKDVKHDPQVVGATAAHLVLPWVHRVFANAKRGASPTGCDRRTSRPTSTSSSSASTAAAPRRLPSTASWASLPASSPPATKC